MEHTCAEAGGVSGERTRTFASDIFCFLGDRRNKVLQSGTRGHSISHPWVGLPDLAK